MHHTLRQNAHLPDLLDTQLREFQIASIVSCWTRISK